MPKIKKMPYLAQFSSKQKSKTTFFSSILKVGENKVGLFLHFELNWVRYGPFFIFEIWIWKAKSHWKWKWSYLAQFSSKQKSKTTFFSSILKVGENKVCLFLHFELNWARYGPFLFLRFGYEKLKVVEHKNGHISLNLAQNKKIRPLSFLQL